MIAAPGQENAKVHRLEQASLWLQRMRAPGQDERVVEAWLDWCQADPLNQQAFDDIAAIWESSGPLAVGPQSALAEADASAVHGRRLMSRRALAASLAGFGFAIAASAWWLHAPRDGVVTTELSSPVGVNSVQMLADGSMLELGGGTRVSVTIGKRARRVELHEGELFVIVHHDVRWPFSVDAGRLEVIATGTAFNVLRTIARTTVTVTEGSVAAFHEGLADSAPNVRLKSGQQLVYSHASHSFDVREAVPGNATAWRSGTLAFQGEPLSEVIETINRYAAKSILIDAAEVKALPFKGTARTTQIDAWVRALPHVFPVAIAELDDGRRLIEPQPGIRSD